VRAPPLLIIDLVLYLFYDISKKMQAVFYFDHNYLENMLYMFRKVNSKERVIGFYSTGPQIRPNDLRIYDVVDRFVSGPSVFCIIDIRPDRPDLPVTAYKAVEEVSSSSSSSTNGSKRQQAAVRRSFAHVPSRMGALESEEIGVEHLLRDINDPTVSTVATLIRGKMAGLATLAEKLVECRDYLENVAAAANDGGGGGATAQPSEEIVSNLQTILNLLPNLNTPDLVRSMIVKTNDMHMAIYLAALIRSVIALHDLVNNKIRYGEDGMDQEEEEQEKGTKDGKAKSGGKEGGEEKKDEKEGENDKNRKNNSGMEKKDAADKGKEDKKSTKK